MRLSSPLPVALLTALAYALTGWAAVRLALAPAHAASVYPSAGIALAAALTYGWPALLGSALGAIAVNLGLVLERGTLSAAAVAAALAIGAGVWIQAALGRTLVRRFLRPPLLLSDLGDVLRFYALGGPVACLSSASVATLALLAAGIIGLEAAPASWLTWWLGDLLGVLLAAPVVLALIGQPRDGWQSRRLVVVLPMLAMMTLLAGVVGWVAQAHEQRVRAAFERDAWSLANAFDAGLRQPLDVLQAMHGLFDSQEHITPDEMARAARPWLKEQPAIAAIGYSQRVDPAEVAAFEARVRAEGPVADYRVFDRTDDLPAPTGRDLVAIRYIEPLEPNRRALGVNAMSIRAARRAILRAAATGEPAATAGFRLTQDLGDRTGIVLYQALYDGDPGTDEERRHAFLGVVFVTLRLDSLVDELLRSAPSYLHWCLIDLDPGADRPRLAGPEGCESRAPDALQFRRARMIGPRALEWRIDADPATLPQLGDGSGRLFSMAGVLVSALLGALLLIVSGRQRRIELAVSERTADLEEASRALRDSQERLRSIVDYVPIGVLYADAEGRLREANPGLLSMLGLAALPVPATRLLDWVHPDDRPAVSELLGQLQAVAHPPRRLQVRLTDGSGRVVTVRLGLSAMHDADGRVHRVVGVLEDIGEHLQLEASEQARRSAEAASRAKSEFVGRMSHELRTPLNAMLGFTQLLARDASPPLAAHQRQWTEKVQDAGWHLLNMINDTLDLSVIESGALRLDLVALDPRVLLDATSSLVAASAERRGIVLHPPEVDPHTPPLLGDETRVKQVLTNLLSNAVKYNVAGGSVRVRVAEVDDGVRIEVEDTGIGLRAAQLDQLFQPFNRLGRERSSVEGTGIGLVISRRLAECMGGRLEASSVPGRGSTFHLWLPRAAVGARPSSGPGPEAAQPCYRRRRVLYVEDNETNAMLMRGMLAQRKQVELSVVTMGLDALTDIRTQRPDLVLLDMHLPDIDGLDLLIHLKADDATAGIPVIVLSADATASRIQRAMQAGAAAYLSKPLDLSELLREVDDVLERSDTVWNE